MLLTWKRESHNTVGKLKGCKVVPKQQNINILFVFCWLAGFYDYNVISAISDFPPLYHTICDRAGVRYG